jgi:hypothetical protein
MGYPATQGLGGDLQGLSNELWKFVPEDLLVHGNRDYGWMAGDDFSNYALTGVPSSSLANAFSEGNYYKTFEVKGSQANVQGIIPSETTYQIPSTWDVPSPLGGAILIPRSTYLPERGAIVMTPTAAADNMQMCLGADQGRATALYPHGQFTPYLLNSTGPNYQGDVIFECRLRLSDLNNGGTGNGASGNNACTNFFIGLANKLAVASGKPVATASFDNTGDLLGFGCVSTDNPGQIGLVYNRASGTVAGQGVTSMAGLNLLTMGGVTGIGTGTLSPTLSVAGAGGVPSSVAGIFKAAYFKLGFRWNAANNTLIPFINGVAQDGKVGASKVIGSGLLSTNLGTAAPGCTSTSWPNVPMTFAAGLWQTGSTTYQTLTIDWWRCAQLKTPIGV